MAESAFQATLSNVAAAVPAAQKGVSAPQPSRMDDKVGQDSPQIQERQLQPQVPMRSAPPGADSANDSSGGAVSGVEPAPPRQQLLQQPQPQKHEHKQDVVELQQQSSQLQSAAASQPQLRTESQASGSAPPPTIFPISMILMQQSGKTCRISFDYNPKMHTFEAVGRHLKHRFKLQDAVGKLKQKIQIEYEALKKGEDRSSFVEEDIAIMDDAAFLINRDMRQEILYKQIQRFSHQIRENDAQLLDQWKAIRGEHERHERELSRIENARKEATEQRRKRLLENPEREKESAPQIVSAAAELPPPAATAANIRYSANSEPSDEQRDSKLDVKESLAEQQPPPRHGAQTMSEKPGTQEL